MSVYLQRFSQWSRWLLLPFASLIGAVVGGASYGFIWSFFGEIDVESPVGKYVLPLISGGTFGYLLPRIAHLVAPAGKMAAAISMTGGVLVFQLSKLSILLTKLPQELFLVQRELYVAAGVAVAIYKLRDMHKEKRQSATQEPWVPDNHTAHEESLPRPSADLTPQPGDKDRSQSGRGQHAISEIDAARRAKFRREAERMLREEYEYEVGSWQTATLAKVCDVEIEAGAMPGDAAARFIEIVCMALAGPASKNGTFEALSEEEAEVVEEMALMLLVTINDGFASPRNFPRATRLYLLSKGAPVNRLHEVDDLAEALAKAAANATKSSDHLYAVADFDTLLAIAIERGLVPNK